MALLDDLEKQLIEIEKNYYGKSYKSAQKELSKKCKETAKVIDDYVKNALSEILVVKLTIPANKYAAYVSEPAADPAATPASTDPVAIPESPEETYEAKISVK